MEIAPLSDEVRNTFLVKAEELASQGLRVIGLGSKYIPATGIETLTREEVEQKFVFRGLAGIFDPPRPETLGAVRSCKQAGIVVHMLVSRLIVITSLLSLLFRLTGDHVTTARAIAEAVEIISPDAPASAVMTVRLMYRF